MSRILQNEVSTLNTFVRFVILNPNEMLSQNQHFDRVELPGLFSSERLSFCFEFHVLN